MRDGRRRTRKTDGHKKAALRRPFCLAEELLRSAGRSSSGGGCRSSGSGSGVSSSGGSGGWSRCVSSRCWSCRSSSRCGCSWSSSFFFLAASSQSNSGNDSCQNEGLVHFLRSLMIFKKTISGNCQKKPKPEFKLFFDRGKDSSSFYPALNYMPDITSTNASLKTLSRLNTTARRTTALQYQTYSPRVVAGKAGELFSKRSLRRSRSATRLPTSEPATPVHR